MKSSLPKPSKNHRRFFYHYNKPNKCLTVHYLGKCLLTQSVLTLVSTESKENKNAQPHIVMQGWCKSLQHTNKITTIS